jgi:ppGpp synthetase/RelA/SpoT-type nucleotidyltranferase
MPKDIDSVLAEFDAKKEALLAFAEKTKTLIEEFLQDAKIQYQSVQARVKTKEKLRVKYLDPTKKYEALADITDQVALRIITYYEDEIDGVAEVIKREFKIDPVNSVDKREMEPNKFGYYALNYICQYTPERISQVEYKKFSDINCEIQITSILRHAWSEIEHPWYDLKGAFPDNIKRRFARMAALLEIAESEFLSLRKLQGDYQRSVDIQVEAQISNIAVDAVSLRSFIDRDPIVSEIDNKIALIRHGRLSDTLSNNEVESRVTATRLAGITKLSDLHNLLEKYRDAIPEFISVWTKHQGLSDIPGGRVIAKGISIHNLCVILVGNKSIDALQEFMREFKALPAQHLVARLAEMIGDIRKKYGMR